MAPSDISMLLGDFASNGDGSFDHVDYETENGLRQPDAIWHSLSNR